VEPAIEIGDRYMPDIGPTKVLPEASIEALDTLAGLQLHV